MKLATLLLLAAIAGPAQARASNACTDDIEAALRTVDDKAEIPGEVWASDCRPWPAAPGRITAAVMAFEKPGSGGNNDLQWQIVIALVDVARGKALSSHRVMLEEDGTTFLGSDSLSLDLAPYLLKPGVRALGLRFTSVRYVRTSNGRSGSPLRLYVPEGPRLRPVFCQAMGWQDAGEGVIGRDAWTEAEATLSLTSRQTQGWRDLRITEKITYYGSPDGRDDGPTPPSGATPSHRQCLFADGVYRCAPGSSRIDTDCDPAGL